MAFLTKTETGAEATNGVYGAYPRTKTFRYGLGGLTRK